MNKLKSEIIKIMRIFDDDYDNSVFEEVRDRISDLLPFTIRKEVGPAPMDPKKARLSFSIFDDETVTKLKSEIGEKISGENWDVEFGIPPSVWRREYGFWCREFAINNEGEAYIIDANFWHWDYEKKRKKYNSLH